jgi:diguanylate cyclase (GGDEF)-like protein
MRRPWLLAPEEGQDETYLELLRALFYSAVPTAALLVLYAGMARVLLSRLDSPFWHGLIWTGLALSALRVLHMGWVGKKDPPTLDRLDAARRHERLYTVSTFVFYTCAGALGFHLMTGPDVSLKLLFVGFMFCNCIGLLARVYVRPRICFPSLMLIILPTTFGLLLTGGEVHVTLGLIMLLTCMAGYESVRYMYHSTVRQIALQRHATRVANEDELTGLANRHALRDRVASWADQPPASDWVGVLYIDLDRFKPVNDTYGHEVGDALLRAVAGRLQNALRHGEFTARIGGDEFIVLLPGVDNPDRARLLSDRLISVLSQPYLIQGHDVKIGATIGVSIERASRAQFDSLLGHADEALYEGKRRGRGVTTISRHAA